MSHLEDRIKPYSKAMVKVLKGPVNRNSTAWGNIIHYQDQIQDQINPFGLELIIKKEEGFAYVRQFEDGEGNTLGLVVRRQIGFETTIVLIVLRQVLEEFDNNPTQFQVSEKFITDIEIREEVELFFPQKFNRVKLIKEMDNCIKKVMELGYLIEVSKKESETLYQIHRIIKEKITLDTLMEFKVKLDTYVKYI
ncbi:DUF4194 domain-containing protein [Dyadobacter sp. 3J3]|uniref:DUF4194 domain-containing protein n=1 Tax=Dyadobacter sp. 3J3 TaxID=2606600 RepID=UPI001357BF5D|nr:DUF4194 domain-containing protein [Dyadobacter sp. 3J3]